jgi:hypothetical protein
MAPDGNATNLSSTTNGYISGSSTSISLSLVKDWRIQDP